MLAPLEPVSRFFGFDLYLSLHVGPHSNASRKKNDAHDTIITGTNQGFTIETAHREAMNGDLRP